MEEWKKNILAESAAIGQLAKSPEKISRIGKHRRTSCKGGCGRRVWDDYCRKCRRALARAAKKGQKKCRATLETSGLL